MEISQFHLNHIDQIQPFDSMEDDLLNDVAGGSIFCNDFPTLPDFPCMSSSSSSSSSNPAPGKSIPSSSSTASSSSASSWAVLKSETQGVVKQERFQPEVSADITEGSLGEVDCMDVMADFGYMDLIDPNDFWDPTPIFNTENEDLNQQQQSAGGDQNPEAAATDSSNGVVQAPLDDLAAVFFEWLKSNKEYISAEDMRSIKLKRSTVESASKRLGGSKEGKKQLLKLILEWVEQCQLQKKQRLSEEAAAAAQAEAVASGFHTQFTDNQYQNPNPNFTPDLNIYCAPPPPPPPYMVAPPYSGGPPMPNYHQHQMMDSGQAWGVPQYPPNPYPENYAYNNNSNYNFVGQGQVYPGYVDPYPNNQYYAPPPPVSGGEEVFRMSGASATKEARKKRMARQKRLLSHHHRNHKGQQSGGSHNFQQNQNAVQQGGYGEQNCVNNGVNWGYWPNAGVPPPSPMMFGNAAQPDRPPAVQPQDRQQQRQATSDRRQGWKSEKNLKFLLQKVLKQSDVGNLGRIVLPKKEAETHLPELLARDGMSIAMEDIGSSRVWNMRYRFWPNNKSRMYLLENTGDFVKANGLQEGDFIVIYSDVKCGKYLIRGVKVRQQGLSKAEDKKPAKARRNNILMASPSVAATGNGSSSSHQALQKY